MNQMKDFINFVFAYQKELGELVFEHIGLTIVSLAIALLIGLPIGILLTRNKKISELVLGFIGTIQTIPSVALLGLLLPLFGIGPVPAIIALFLYALLPIVRNTFTGIEEVEASIKEAAKGMGMSDLQILSKVELSLASPVIFAGIRTATVINVGVATLCALIAAGGLGEFIFRGIQLNNINMILAGAIPAAMLALLFDLVLGFLQRHINKILKPAFIIPSILLVIALCFISMPSIFHHGFQAGFVHEFMERMDGYRGLVKTYNLSLKTKELESGLMFEALINKKVDLIGGYTTDGRITAYNLVILEDDKKIFPPYSAVPLVKGTTIRKHPALRNIFSKIAGKITDKKMRELNFKAEQEKIPVKKVAKDFLEELGFRTNANRTGTPDIIIDSKNFTEQFILVEIFSILIENYTELNTDVKKGLAGTQICFEAIKKGEIDIYPEYTGTGLFVILKSPQKKINSIISDSNKVYKYVSNESKKLYDLEWLEPLGFNNSWALIMRREQADKLRL